VLFDEADARAQTPKAVAAKRRLEAINSQVKIEASVVDVHSGNIQKLADGVDLILDGTDNVETRYLVNDAAVKMGIPWVYGACVGMQGRVLGIVPGRGPCLRCLFNDPASPGELETCDTAGVLASAANVVASLEVAAAIKILLNEPIEQIAQLVTVDVWRARFRTMDAAGARRDECPACGRRNFEFLNRPDRGVAALCGRGAVQVRPGQETVLDLARMQQKLTAAGQVTRTDYFLRFVASDSKTAITLFPDGRALIHGVSDTAAARSLYARYIGT
jgi:adenylyltransferase/sulfurtransferase